MTRRRYGFDVDGVQADFPSAYQALTVKHAGVDLFHPGDDVDPPRWHWPQFRGYSEELMDFESGPVWSEIRSNPRFWLDLAPLPGASDLRTRVRDLERRHDLYFVTNRTGVDAKGQTEKWLCEHVGVKLPTVLLSASKGLCAQALGLDAYIDDHLPNAIDVAQRSPSTRVYLLERRYNQDPRAFGSISRVGSVREMLEREGLL